MEKLKKKLLDRWNFKVLLWLNALGPRFTAEAIGGDLIYTFSKTNTTHMTTQLQSLLRTIKNAKFLLIGFKFGFSLKTLIHRLIHCLIQFLIHCFVLE